VVDSSGLVGSDGVGLVEPSGTVVGSSGLVGWPDGVGLVEPSGPVVVSSGLVGSDGVGLVVKGPDGPLGVVWELLPSLFMQWQQSSLPATEELQIPLIEVTLVSNCVESESKFSS